MEHKLKTIETSYNEMGKFAIELCYGRFYNYKLNKIVTKNYIPIIYTLEWFTLHIPSELFMYDVWGFQIFLKLEEKNIDHEKGGITFKANEDVLKVRVNASFWMEVKCRIVEQVEIEINKTSFDAKKTDCTVYGVYKPVSLKIFDKDIKEISKYNITQIYHPRTKESMLYYDFSYPAKGRYQGNEFRGDFLTIDEFIKYSKEEGIKIERRTIEKYTFMKMFPKPYKSILKNKKVNMYHKEWIIYLKEIEKYRKKGINHLNKIRGMNPEFFKGADNYNLPVKTVQS